MLDSNSPALHRSNQFEWYPKVMLGASEEDIDRGLTLAI